VGEVTVVAWGSEAPKGCRMPEPMDAGVAKVCEGLRKIHCAEGKSSHDCSGRLIIDRNGLTLACPLCGDERQVYRREEA